MTSPPARVRGAALHVFGRELVDGGVRRNILYRPEGLWRVLLGAGWHLRVGWQAVQVPRHVRDRRRLRTVRQVPEPNRGPARLARGSSKRSVRPCVSSVVVPSRISGTSPSSSSCCSRSKCAKILPHADLSAPESYSTKASPQLQQYRMHRPAPSTSQAPVESSRVPPHAPAGAPDHARDLRASPYRTDVAGMRQGVYIGGNVVIVREERVCPARG